MTRRCPGIGDKTCGQYRSNSETDPHTLCHRCRGQKCSVDNTCDQCVSWDPTQWKKFEGRKSYAVQKSEKGTPKPPKTPKTPVKKSPEIPPPFLVKEAPFIENLSTPLKGMPKPVFPPVPPTPVTKLQQETKERFLSLETSFETKMEAMMLLVKSMAQRPVAQHVVDAEKVNVIVVEKDDDIPEASSVKPKNVVPYLEECEQAIPQSKTSEALADARRATASASVLLLGDKPKSEKSRRSRSVHPVRDGKLFSNRERAELEKAMALHKAEMLAMTQKLACFQQQDEREKSSRGGSSREERDDAEPCKPTRQ